MKIKTNDVKLFQSLGDCFPTFSDMETFLSNYVTIFNRDFINISPVISNTLYGDYNQRRISSLFELLNEDNGVILYGVNDYYTPDAKTLLYLGNTIELRFSDKWKRYQKLLDLDYDAIKPLQLETDNELISDHLTSKNVVDATRKSTGKDTTNNTTEYDRNANKSYGFNSTIGVDTDSSENTSKDSSITDTDMTNKTDDTTDYTRDATSHRKVNRSGNIGNRLPSEMLEKEIEFRKIQLADIMVDDILSVLTRSKYI